MARSRTAAREFVLALLSLLIAIVTGVEWIGVPLRLVHVLTLVVLGAAAGVAFARGMMRVREDRQGKIDSSAA